MLADPHRVEPALDLILISRHLERIGDHATNVAEDVIFMVSALDVRHHAADGRSRLELILEVEQVLTAVIGVGEWMS